MTCQVKQSFRFATSGGSGMGKTVDVLSKLSPNAKWQTGKMVNGISEKKLKIG